MQMIKLQAKDRFWQEAVLKAQTHCIGQKVRRIHCVHHVRFQINLKHLNQVHQEKSVQF